MMNKLEVVVEFKVQNCTKLKFSVLNLYYLFFDRSVQYNMELKF